jgi:hypothetical protein
MNVRPLAIGTLVLAVLGGGCALSGRGTGMKSVADSAVIVTEVPTQFVQPVQPGTCRVVATVVAVDTTFRGDKSNDPCSTTPCRARIRIDSVAAVGPDFPGYLIREGDIVVASFPGTLGPHDELFNGLLVRHYDGLQNGDRFRADVALETAPVLGVDPATSGALTIYVYDRLNE